MLVVLAATLGHVSLHSYSRPQALRSEPHIALTLRGGFDPLHAYANALTTSPLVTNVVTASALSVLADGIAQKISSSSDREAMWDYARSRWQAVWGAFVSGFAMYHWFGFLGRLFPDARTNVLELAKKLFVNQLFLSPGLNAGFFAFVVLTRNQPSGWMNSEKWGLLKAKLSKDLLAVCMRSNVFWICVQTLNFAILPESLTVMSTNFFFVIWTVYLCLVSNRAAEKRM